MPVYHHPFNPSRGGDFGPSRGAQALFQALGGQGRQEAMAAELDRLAKLDLQRSQMGLHDAQATAAREKTRLDRDQFDAGENRRNLRMDPGFLTQVAGMRLPELAPADVNAVVRRGMGGPFEMPASVDPMQRRLLGETLAGVFAGGAADGPTNAEQMANVVTRAGSSAQRLAAPQLAAEDPITAAFMLNAGTDKAAPDLYGALPDGLGTFGKLTGLSNYDVGMKGAALGKSEAEAAKHRAAAAQSYASAAASSASAAKTRQDMNRYIDPDRGGATDLQSGIFKPWTMVGGAPLWPKQAQSVVPQGDRQALSQQLGVPVAAADPTRGMSQKGAESMHQRLYAASQKEIGQVEEAVRSAKEMARDADRFIELQGKVRYAQGPIMGNLPGWWNPEAQEMDAIQNRLAPKMRDTGSGATSDFEQRMFKSAIFGRDKDDATNKAIATLVRERAQREAEYAEFLQDYLTVNGHLDGAKRDWSRYIEANPIFDPTRPGALEVNNGRKAYREFFGAQGERAPSGMPVAPPSTTPPAPSSAGRRVVRTGVSNGRRVAQYDDGSIEYAE